MMLNSKTINLALICFFLCGSTKSTLALNENSFLINNYIIAQEPEALNTGAYLIIGVFEYEKNALKLTKKALEDGLDAHCSYREENGYYYVYTHRDSSKNEVIQAYHQIRTIHQYKDAWILSVHGAEVITNGINEADQNEEEDNLNASKPEQKVAIVSSEAENIPTDEFIVNFRALNREGEPIKVEIQLVDGKRANLIDHIDSDTDWVLNKKSIALDTIQIISQATGYQKVQLDLDILHTVNNTTTPISHIKNDTIFVNLELRELEKGDIQVMFNTYFYGNSTVMRIQSKYELEEVYKMLTRNPNMRIKLHGHTNGFSRGKAYLFLEEKQNFFELDRTKEYEKKGLSSTKLSAYRAETIKSYLTSHGIASDRIETIGWGGKKMMYDSGSPMAKNNIRVEIEVLSK